jgi:hypothetical protein
LNGSALLPDFELSEIGETRAVTKSAVFRESRPASVSSVVLERKKARKRCKERRNCWKMEQLACKRVEGDVLRKKST